MSPRPWRLTILAFCGSAAASSVLALGFGRIPDSTVFGQPLDLSLPLRIDAGESVAPACLSAEVSIGEQRVPATSLRLTVERGEGGSRVRLRSPVVVLEPLVSVNVAVGCNGSVARQFVVFADPPGHRMEPAAVFAAAAETPALPPAASAVRRPPVAAVGGGATGRADKTKSSTRRGGGEPSQSAASVDAAKKAARKGAATAARRNTPVRSAAGPAPRLTLEEPDERLQAVRLAVAAQDAAVANAEKTALAAQTAASAAETRLAALEQELQTLRADGAAQRAAIGQLRDQLAKAEQRRQMNWPLLALLGLLGAVTLWLGLRLRALQRERQAGWWQLAQAGAPSPSTGAAGEAREVAPAALHRLADHAVPSEPAVGPEALLPEDQASGLALAAALAPRPLSVDELIDLEQQVDFFVVLGEDTSAVDLLMMNLRGSGGVSPLPYLRLLEIHRRGDDREAYERIAKRFGDRFSAVAPGWEDDLQGGRSLLDYPAVVAGLQSVWAEPRDAMAELDSLLFRRHGSDLFELPAYRDVLSLYAVARDLQRCAEGASAGVDLLLPLGPLHKHEIKASASIFDRLDSPSSAGAALWDELPIAPIDVDLSEPGVAPDAPLEERDPVLRAPPRRS
jgi:hypothetical protein